MQNQAISMNVLHELYGLQTHDTRYRNKLKHNQQSAFPKKNKINISASAIYAQKN